MEWRRKFAARLSPGPRESVLPRSDESGETFVTSPPKASRSVRASLVLAYAFAGLLIVILSGVGAQVYQVPLRAQLGLFQMLPPTYWLGLALIAFAALLAYRQASNALVVVTGAILLAVLAGTPSLFEPTPRYWDAYMHFAQAQQLALSGRIASGDPSAYSVNWPGAFLIMWTLAGATAVTPLAFLSLFPFLVGAITFVAMFELLRSIVPDATARAAAVPTALFAVWAQYHVSPQSLGFILALLILAIVRRPETKWRFICATLFVSLVVSHPTSAILLITILSAFAVLSILPRLFRSSRATGNRDGRSWARIAVTFTTVWLSWLFFLAIGSSEAARTAVIARMDVLLNVPEQTLNLVTARTAQNVFPLAPLIRSASLGLYGLVGVASLAVLFRDRSARNEFRFVLAALIGLGVVAVADIFAFSGQFYDRSILLFATFAPALCFAGLRRIQIPRAAKTAVVILLVGASVATASTAYYLEAFNIVPTESIAAADFVNRLPPYSVAVDGKFPEPIWLDPGSRVPVIRLGFAQEWPTPLDELSAPGAVYAVYDPTAQLWYRQWYGINIYQPYADARSNYSLIYDNGWTQMYEVHG